MEKIGVTLKKIRINQGLTIKETYGGIISRSFANRLEHGKSDLQAAKLLQILNNLAITPDEFQFINNKYNASKSRLLFQEINQLYKKDSFSLLSSWIKKHQKQNQPDEKIIVTYAKIILYFVDHGSMPMTQENIQFVNFLLGKKTWNIQELQMIEFVVILIYDYSEAPLSQDELIQKIEHNFQLYLSPKYDPFHVRKNLINFYGLMLQHFYSLRDFNRAQKINYKLTKIKQNFDLTITDLVTIKFWFAIKKLYLGDFHQGDQEIKEIFKFQEFIDSDLHFKGIYDYRIQDALNYRKKNKNFIF